MLSLSSENLIIRNLVGIFLLSLVVNASLHRIRRPLPSNSNERRAPSIFTRGSSVKPPHYGVRGSTAAEFVVSAGLDTKKSAVRIYRKIEEPENVGKAKFFRLPYLYKEQMQKHFKIRSAEADDRRKRLLSDIAHHKPWRNIVSPVPKSSRYKRDLDASAVNETSESTVIHERSESEEDNNPNDDRARKNLSLNLMSIIAQADDSSREAEVQYTATDDDNTAISRLTNITTPILRHLVLSHLIDTIIKMRNVSSSDNAFNDSTMRTFNEDFRDIDDMLTPAEQKQYGIIVNPYGAISSIGMKSSGAPVVRVLRGKLVPLEGLPPELIPILLGTYNPTYTNSDDPKVTESMIDSAIYTLLQNEDLLNIAHLASQQTVPIGGKVATRKSPSTNYIGSVKTSEPMITQNVYRPTLDYLPEWRPGPRCDRLTEEICLDDSDYPSSAIMSSIYKDKNKFDLMYAEVKERESQVDGLSRNQEQQYTFDHYFGATSPGAVVVRPVDYGPRGGFVCPSEVHYARPHRAKNRKGEWKVVVNVAEYTQTLRMEKCLSAGNPCKYVVSHMQSTCSQVYNYHRLLVFNKDQGLHVDVFRVPSACACHIRGHSLRYSQPHPFRGHHDDFGSHIESAPSVVSENVSPNKKKKKNNFSNTLWAILGGGQQAGSLAQSPQFLDEVRKQISWTQQMKHFPQLLKHVSPYQVLRQLLEEDEEEEEERIAVRRHPNRQIHRYKIEAFPHGAFATSHVPVSVSVRDTPIPVMPSEQMTRLPMPGTKQLFTVGSNQKNVFNSPGDHKTIFALPENPSIIGTPQDQVGLLVEPSAITFKIQPGMRLPGHGKIQISEDQLVPIAPQFSDTNLKDTPFRPVLKPMPMPKNSKTKVVEDEDLIAVEKSGGDSNLHAFFAETQPPSSDKDEEDNTSKINFSYHPILEYLSL